MRLGRVDYKERNAENEKSLLVPNEYPRLFVDHNVSMRTVERLRRLRFVVETAFEAKLSAAKDEEVLLAAVNRGALLLTHDEHDYKLLFRAWHRWSDAWDASQNHAGILVFPQTWSPDFALPRLLALFDETESFENSLVRLRNPNYVLVSHASDPASWPN
jgi:hypothetical protein